MASGTITGSTSNSYIDSKIEWSSTPDVASNSSSVTAKLYYRRNNSGYTTSGTGSFSITINGTKKTASNVALDIGTAWVLAMTATVTVAHADDGKKSITISATGSLPPSSLTSTSCSGTVTLDTIARSSEPTVSASSVVMKNTVTITTNRKSSSFTHDLTYSFGGSTGTIATGVGESYPWPVPDLVSKIPGKSSGTCTITCKTKSGSTVIGTKTCELTFTIPTASAPTAADCKMGKSVTVYTNRKSTGYTHTLTYAVGNATGTIGTGVTDSKPWTPPKSLVAYTGNKTSITCTITCKTYNGSLLVGTDTTTMTLTVPDATVPAPAVSTVALGEEITIVLPRAVDSYFHDLTYSLKADGSSEIADSGTIATGQETGYVWPVPLALAAKIPRATKGIVAITCKTWLRSRDIEVGTTTNYFTVTVPDNSTTQPQVKMTLSPVSDLPEAFNDVYVAGKSKVQVSYEASSDYSTIRSYRTTLPDQNGTGNPYISPVLNNPDTMDITGKVTDSRGYFTEITETIKVVDYHRPRIIPAEGKNSIVCKRCNSDGTPDPGGVHLLIQIGRKYSKVISGDTQKNFCTLSYRYKTDGADESGYSTFVELLTADTDSDYANVILSGVVVSNITAYNIQFIAQDDVGEKDTVTITVPTAFVTFHSPPGGHGFTFGGYHDPSKYDVFDCLFDAEFQGDVYGRALGMGRLPEIPEGADANDYTDFGAWAVTGNIANLPENKQGTLRVWSADGRGDKAEHKNIIQEYIPADNYCSWRRNVWRADDSWECGTWKAVTGADAIVEQGETDVWHWKKYANGIAECWAGIYATVNITTGSASGYHGTLGQLAFPFVFSEVPDCYISACISGGSTAPVWAATSGAPTTNSTAIIYVMSTTGASTAYCHVSCHAIGKWK